MEGSCCRFLFLACSRPPSVVEIRSMALWFDRNAGTVQLKTLRRDQTWLKICIRRRQRGGLWSCLFSNFLDGTTSIYGFDGKEWCLWWRRGSEQVSTGGVLSAGMAIRLFSSHQTKKLSIPRPSKLPFPLRVSYRENKHWHSGQCGGRWKHVSEIKLPGWTYCIFNLTKGCRWNRRCSVT